MDQLPCGQFSGAFVNNAPHIFRIPGDQNTVFFVCVVVCVRGTAENYAAICDGTLSCSYPCTNNTVSHKIRLMHACLNTTLLTLCHADMFEPSRAICRVYDWYVSAVRSTEWVTRCNIQWSRGSRVTCLTLNFTSGNSFCWPCCWNVPVVLPEDDPLRVETCRRDTVLIKWRVH